MVRVSRGFVAALGGLAMTLLAWFGSWAWPGWPASLAIDLLGRYSPYPDVPGTAKIAVVVALIITNVGTWAIVIRVAIQLLPGRDSIRR